VSERENDSVNGENAPACGLLVPAVNDGANPDTQPLLIVNESKLDTGGVPLHGVNELLVVYVPHASGVASTPCGPPKKFS